MLGRVMPGPARIGVTRFDSPMKLGSAVHLEVGVGPLRLPWELTVVEFEPGQHFVDLQTGRGPMAAWRHTHAFETAGAGTRVIDRIEYSLPLGWLGRLGAAVGGPVLFHLMFAARKRNTRRVLEIPA